MIVNTIFKEIGVDGVVGDSNINSLTKGGYWGNIEKYFHCLFDNACLHYMKKEFKKALEEFQAKKFLFQERAAQIIYPDCEPNGKLMLKTEYLDAFPDFEVAMLAS